MLLTSIGQPHMHELFRYIHILTSIAFLLFAISLITRSIIGISKHKAYTGVDRFLAYATIITLYVQLFLGVFLFTNYGPLSGNQFQEVADNARLASNRLWPIQHIVLMFFALMIATLGLILSAKSKVDRDKHKKILIYYVIAILIIAQSLCAIYIF
jgi:heme A synthase